MRLQATWRMAVTAWRRPPAWVGCLGLWLVFLGVAAISLHPLGTELARRLPDNPDSLYWAWLLSWLSHQLGTRPWALFQANILFPDPASLAYGPTGIGVGLLAWPFWAATGNDVATHNLALILTLSLCALSMFLLARELAGSVAAGVVAGEVFAFTTANFDSVARMQIVSSQWTPLCLLFLLRTLRSRHLLDGLGFGLCFALQGLACTYYEIYFAILLTAVLPFLPLVVPRPSLKNVPWGPLCAGGAIALLLLLPVNLEQYAHLQRIVNVHQPAHPAGLESYAVALPSNWLYGERFGLPGVRYDSRYFTGFLPLVLAGLGIGVLSTRRRRILPESGRRFVPLLVALGGLGFILAFGAEVPTPFGPVSGPFSWLASWVPGLGATRVPARFAMFVRLGLSVLAAVGVGAMVKALGRTTWRGLAVAALVVLLPLEHLSTPLPTWRLPVGDEIPAVYGWLADHHAGERPAIVEFPPFPVRLRHDECWWSHVSTRHWLPMVNGYASFYPVWFDYVYDALLDLPDPRSFRVLRTLDVEYVVFHPKPSGHEEGERAIRRFRRFVARPQAQVELVKAFDDRAAPADDAWAMLGGEELYRVVPRALPAPSETRVEGLQRVDRTGWRCESRPAAGGCERAFDDDPATSFRTGSPQRQGNFIRVYFPRPVELQAVALASGRWSQYYPRRPGLRGLAGGKWRTIPHRLNDVEFLQGMLRNPDQAAMQLTFRPIRLSLQRSPRVTRLCSREMTRA